MKRVGVILREGISSKIKDNVQKSGDIFMVTYTKVSSAKMDNFRKALKKSGARVYVSKNKISKKTLQAIQYDRLADKIKGQTAFIWCESDSAEISKTLTKFTKECQDITIQGGLLAGKVIEPAQIKSLSELPSKDVLLSTLLGTMQSPVTQFLGALNSKSQDLLSILKQLSEKK